ncbi:hypothetical protein F4781DRAFT_409668 [Annulohypoxylon bovei var. microspora]|nr:hypothetical protein F4781DRAFT_409668 [Annulohypoxylon bovei var. microspora]
MTSLYDLTVPVLTKILQTEVSILKDGEKWAKENGKSIDDLLKARLISDMYPLSIQVSITVMFVKKTLQLLVGADFEPSVKEISLEECHSILQETLADLAKVKPESINGRESEILEFSIGKQTTKAPGFAGVQRTVLPTVYFHLTILYSILRKEGVPLGKLLYLTHFIDGFTLS